LENNIKTKEDLIKKITQSYFITDNKNENLAQEIMKQGQFHNQNEIFNQTDSSNLMEGLYIKVEEDGIVKERYKFVRQGFLQVVADSESHWLDRPIIPNKLKGDINDLFI
jgi:hypothetical protein